MSSTKNHPPPPQKKKGGCKKWPKNDPKPLLFWKIKPAGANFSEHFLEIYPSPSPRQLWQRKVYFGIPRRVKNVSWSWWWFASWWNLQKICIPNLPDVFFSDDSPFGSGIQQNKSQDPRDPFVMKGSIGLTIFGRSMSPAWKGGTCYIIFCWHCGVLITTVNCCKYVLEKDPISLMCCLWMFVRCKRIDIPIYEGKYSIACTTPSNTFILTIPEKHRIVPKMSLCRSFSPRDSPIPQKITYFIRYYSRRVS